MFKENILVSTLTNYEKYRFRKEAVCPLCGKLIFDNQKISFQKDKLRRYSIYTFFHSKCVNHYKEKFYGA